jgi:hypothetical protein
VTTAGLVRIAVSRLGSNRRATLLCAVGVGVSAAALPTLLTAQNRATASIRTLTEAHFREPYDLLVRRRGSALGDAAGGAPWLVPRESARIAASDVAKVRRVKGVAVAAPLAYVGYVFATVDYELPVTFDNGQHRSLYRTDRNWSFDHGESAYNDAPQFSYFTPRAIDPAPPAVVGSSLPAGSERTAAGPRPICPTQPYAGGSEPSPTSLLVRFRLTCTSLRTGPVGIRSAPPSERRAENKPVVIEWSVPLMVAAVDPPAEDQMYGLGKRVIGGRDLRENDGLTVQRPVSRSGRSRLVIPAIWSASPTLTDRAFVRVRAEPDRLANRLVGRSDASRLRRNLTNASALQTVWKGWIAARQVYSAYLREGTTIDGYWEVGPVAATQHGTMRAARAVQRPSRLWRSEFHDLSSGYVSVPASSLDSAVRPVRRVRARNAPGLAVPTLSRVGTFALGSATARVQDGTEFPATTDEISSDNVGGWGLPAPAVLTNLTGLRGLTDQRRFVGVSRRGASVDVIRVKVAGVTGPDEGSVRRIAATAARIRTATGLQVDVVAGAADKTVRVVIPPGRFGRRARKVTDRELQAGIVVDVLAVTSRYGIDSTVVVMIAAFCLCLLEGTALAAGRRQDNETFRSIGWSSRACSAVAVIEGACTGAIAALLATALLALAATSGGRWTAAHLGGALTVVGVWVVWYSGYAGTRTRRRARRLARRRWLRAERSVGALGLATAARSGDGRTRLYALAVGLTTAVLSAAWLLADEIVRPAAGTNLGVALQDRADALRWGALGVAALFAALV